MARLRDGGVLVANEGSGELKFFDSQGRFVRSVGRAGEGPGEFRSLKRVAELEDGRIAALDIRLRRATVFAASGELERTFQVSSPVGELGPRVELFDFLHNGSLVGIREIEGEGSEVVYGSPSRRLTFKAPVVQPVIIDTMGRTAPFGRPLPGTETLSQMETSTAGGMVNVGGIGGIPVPFLKSVAVAAQGDMITVGHTSRSWPIVVFTEQGTPRAVFGRAGRDLPTLPTGTHASWLDGWLESLPGSGSQGEWRALYEEFISSALAPTTMPAFRTLLVQRGEDVENVWMEEYDPGAPEDAASRWEVVAPTGRLSDAAAAVLPSGFRPYEIGPNHVLGVWKDALGIEYVHVYDLVVLAETPSRIERLGEPTS